MSLKAFHLVFVTALTGLTFGCAVWFFKQHSVLLGCVSILLGIAVLVYGKYFLKKLKKLSYL